MDYSADSLLWTNGNIGFPNDGLAPKRRNILAPVFHEMRKISQKTSSFHSGTPLAMYPT
jgi:hypothetical protein